MCAMLIDINNCEDNRINLFGKIRSDFCIHDCPSLLLNIIISSEDFTIHLERCQKRELCVTLECAKKHCIIMFH